MTHNNVSIALFLFKCLCLQYFCWAKMNYVSINNGYRVRRRVVIMLLFKSGLSRAMFSIRVRAGHTFTILFVVVNYLFVIRFD